MQQKYFTKTLAAGGEGSKATDPGWNVVRYCWCAAAVEMFADAGQRARHGIETVILQLVHKEFADSLVYAGSSGNGRLCEQQGKHELFTRPAGESGCVPAAELIGIIDDADRDINLAAVAAYRKTEGCILTYADMILEGAGAAMLAHTSATVHTYRRAACIAFQKKAQEQTSQGPWDATAHVPSAYITLSIRSEAIRQNGYSDDWAPEKKKKNGGKRKA
jgi:hypothetical protein